MNTDDLITIPESLIKAAQADPILSGYLNSATKRIGIYFKGDVVGFYTPYEDVYKGKSYWRTGNIYILPEFRNKGLGSKTIHTFFKDKPYGMAHVAENNPSSLRAFEKNGFIKQEENAGLNPKGKVLYILIKEPVDVNASFAKW